MKKYRVLCLTDHSGHSAENSVYAILREMFLSGRCEYIDIASRGYTENQSFFYNLSFDTLYGSRISKGFEFDSTGKIFTEGTTLLDPKSYDIIFLRLPRPISDEFLIVLANALDDKIIINDPRGIITLSNKAFLLQFPELCPPMRLVRNENDIHDFASIHDLVLKPLREYGGKGLLKIQGNLVNDGERDYPLKEYLPNIREELTKHGYLAMKYLKNVSMGDKRLLVVGGEVLAASLRLPPKDSWLCNVARGGESVPSQPDSDEIRIVEGIKSALLQNGIFIAGIDTLVNDDGKRVMSEINALSIGGFKQAEMQTGKSIINTMIDKFFNYADAQFQS